MVLNTYSTICASSPRWISMVNAVGIGVLSACNGHGCVSHGQSLKVFVDSKCCLSASQQEPAASKHGAVQFLQDVHLCLCVEIDHDISAENQIERSQCRQTFTQIQRLKSDHAAHLIAQMPVGA